MADFEIFVDSVANLPDEIVNKYDIGVIPYSCTVNGVERLCYEKGGNFSESAKNFYAELKEGADVKTSLIGLARFEEFIAPVLKEGKDAVLLTITSTLSGTNAQALAAKEELEKKYPDNKVYVIDTANASMGSGLLAIKLAELKALGESAESCAQWAEDNAYRINSFVTVDDLKYLRKGGRVSAVAAIAGTLLNIKPVLWANETVPAKLTVFGKERGRKKALATILKEFDERVENIETQTVAITHADCLEDANELAEALKAKGVKDVIIEYYDICTGAHVGPGTLALFFFGKSRKPEQQEAPQKKSLLQTIKRKS